ncbi:MAG: biotin--[acetyl-CoA-carboxylase] ligase [Candidatus Latescibacterota bacterium]|nr:MAG: biotin--[acetyl-CoA-carboxylase] ligase [Candidatus Latescibacterota bacterium]
MSHSADLLPEAIRSRLEGEVFARRIYYLHAVDSTNRLAVELAKSGEAHGTLVIADHQTKGRGRYDRQWESPAGRSLLFSLILRPDASPGTVLPVTLAFSLSIAETLETALAHEVELKWPNDVLVGGRKICGILSESSSKIGRSVFVVVGIGINVNTTMDEFSPDIRAQTTSCYEVTQDAHNRTDLLGKVLGGLESTYDRFGREGFEGFVESYEDKLMILNKTVTFRRGGTLSVGLVTGLSKDGGLVIKKSDDTRVVLYDEEITLSG